MKRLISSRAFSIVEILVVMGLSAVIFAVALFDTKSYENQSLNGANSLMGFLKVVRAKALATTRAYTVTANTVSQVTTTWDVSCGATNPTADPTLMLSLPNGASFAAVPWSICFTPRGLSDSSLDIVVQDAASPNTVQIVLGGAVRVQ